jgi:DNA-binding XRE family transcriptional regulator
MRKRRDFGNKGIIIIFILLKIIISKKNPLMKKKNMNLTTLEEFKEKNYGKRGTKKRDELEAGYESFKLGALIQDTRLEMGMTQEQLAEKVGTTKSYISKIENNIKEARISTLQRIVELGFGGQLEFSIKI